MRDHLLQSINNKSLLRLLEILQIRRRLAASGGHQDAVGAQHITFVTDVDELLALDAPTSATEGQSRPGLPGTPEGPVGDKAE